MSPSLVTFLPLLTLLHFRMFLSLGRQGSHEFVHRDAMRRSTNGPVADLELLSLRFCSAGVPPLYTECW